MCKTTPVLHAPSAPPGKADRLIYTERRETDAIGDLDPTTEKDICGNISQLSKEMAVLAITHRDAWIEIADRVYELDGREVRLVQDDAGPARAVKFIGEILIDDTPLDEIDLNCWRGMVGYVPQELTLIHDTIFNNIALGNPQISGEDVISALQRLPFKNLSRKSSRRRNTIQAPEHRHWNKGAASNRFPFPIQRSPCWTISRWKYPQSV